MPNWCNNVVELAHEDPAMLERARVAFKDGRLLDEFIPVPKELQDTVAGRVGGDEEYAQQLLAFKRELNVKFFGAADWYDWCVAKWGTKWDVGGDDYNTPEVENGQLTLSFDSAWSPPIGAYEKLCDLGFSVRGYYYESGMAFCGVWDDGFDDFYEIGGQTWEQVRDEIPEALDEMFCISENIQEWAAEKEESE
jgi:hypothetical protein